MEAAVFDSAAGQVATGIAASPWCFDEPQARRTLGSRHLGRLRELFIFSIAPFSNKVAANFGLLFKASRRWCRHLAMLAAMRRRGGGIEIVDQPDRID